MTRTQDGDGDTASSVARNDKTKKLLVRERRRRSMWCSMRGSVWCSVWCERCGVQCGVQCVRGVDECPMSTRSDPPYGLCDKLCVFLLGSVGRLSVLTRARFLQAKLKAEVRPPAVEQKEPTEAVTEALAATSLDGASKSTRARHANPSLSRTRTLLGVHGSAVPKGPPSRGVDI
jgi:hypothetical protein